MKKRHTRMDIRILNALDSKAGHVIGGLFILACILAAFGRVLIEVL